MTPKELRAAREHLNSLREQIVAYRGEWPPRDQDDLDLRNVLAYADQIEICFERIDERDWQEQLTYERDMGPDL